MNVDELERRLRKEPPDLPASIPQLSLPSVSVSTPLGGEGRIRAGTNAPISATLGAGLFVALAAVLVLVASRPPDGQPVGVGAEASVNEPSASPAVSENPAVSPSTYAAPSESTLTVTVRLDSAHALALTIVDETGLLVAARSANEVEQAPPDPMKPVNSISAFNPSQAPGNEVRLVWMGTICDRSAELRIGSNATAMTITEGPRGSCDAMGVGRGVVLKFSSSIDASSIALLIR